MKLLNPLHLIETIKLLKRLKFVKAQYPADLLAARRAGFIKQINTTHLNIKDSKTGAQVLNNLPMNRLETVLQLILAGMVLAVSVAAAYVYRDELRDFLLPDSTEVQIFNTVLPSQEPSSIAAPSTTTHTHIPTSTPISSLATKEPSTSNSTLPTTEPTSAPMATETNPGLHLGQTKTPKPK